MNPKPESAAGLVSVIMPAYCSGEFIADSILSVIHQTYPDWELLVADDHSSDQTADIAAYYASLDHRVKLIPALANSGPAAARNRALSLAKGRWIAFLDSDDIWLPTKLAETIEFAIANDAALTYTAFRRFTGTATGRLISVPSSLVYRQLLRNTAIATSTVLVDTQLTGAIRMKSVYYDDYACWLQILRRGFVAYGLRKDLMRYRVVAHSVSRNKIRSSVKVWSTYRQTEKLGLLLSCYCFVHYALNALIKYCFL